MMTDQQAERYTIFESFSSHPCKPLFSMKFRQQIAVIACLLMAFWAKNPTFGQTLKKPGKNSTDKRRVVPSAVAARIGSAVNWVPSFEEAREQSGKTGKPIFWYVPTLENSFMDRKVEIDRYMRAGMFSWPRIIERLNRDFIPVRAVPNRRQAKAYELVPYEFIEPGFLVLNQAGKQSLRCDRLTTQHPRWLEKVLESCFGEKRRASVTEEAEAIDQQVEKFLSDERRILDLAWELFRDTEYHEAATELLSLYTDSDAGRKAGAELDLLFGMCQFRLGNHAEAKRIWRSLGKRFPTKTLAQKAAAEAEGIGPFVRGFEVHSTLPAAVYSKVDPASATSTAPPKTYSEDELWQRGIQFLTGMQRSDGGFVDCDYDFGGTDSLPNVHVAITSICGTALLAASEKKIQTKNRDLQTATGKARAFVLNQANWNPSDSDEIFWAHAYRVRFLAASIRHGWNGNAKLQQAVQGLESMQSPSGSWYHEYPNPMVTSLAMVALKEAAQAGAKINPEVIARGIDSLIRNRGRGGFFYNDVARVPPQARKLDLADASAGRLPLCELALHLSGASTDQQLANAVATSFKKQSHLFAALKYDDHTSRHDYGGFFFWFDIHGRSLAVQKLTDPVRRTRYKEQIRDLIMKLPEIDGCFVDSHEIGRCYGTAMALLTFANTDNNQ